MGHLKKIYCIVLTALGLGAVNMECGAHAAPDLVANYHFIGGKSLANDTNAATLKKVLELPESVTLRSNVLQKLAGLPAHELGKSQNETALIRPLLDDLLRAESMGEWRSGTNGEILFAIRLDENRASLWSTNLSKALSAWTGKSTAPTVWEKFSGWELKQSSTPNLIRFIHAKDWVVFGAGQNQLPLQNNLLRLMSKDGRPPKLKGTNWLEATIDWQKLSLWFPLTNSPVRLVRTEINCFGKNDSLRTVVRAVYPENFKWKSQPWQVPTNLIRDPLISFTAAQNLSLIMNEPQKFQRLSVHPIKDEFFLWAQSSAPFFSFGAIPQKDPKDAFKRLSKEVPQIFSPDLEKEHLGKIIRSTNNQEIIWQGLPFIVPHLGATNGYLFGGLFPSLRSTNLPPSELFAQVTSRTNLVYYDWEITQERLSHWHLLSQILPPFPRKVDAEKLRLAVQSGRANTNAWKEALRLNNDWQAAAGKFLGNTATEITVTGPGELTLTRKSNLGFTGFELTLLIRWLCDPEFPFTNP